VLEVANAVAHRLLAYLAALCDQGDAPTVQELDAYAEEDEPTLAPEWYLDDRGGEPPEAWTWPWAFYLQARGWATVDEGPIEEREVRITKLGRSLLQHLDEQGRTGQVQAVEVLAQGPLSYGRVIGRIAQHDRPMLVDAYFDVDSVAEVVLHTSVSRILLGEKPGKRGRARVAAVIAAMTRFDLNDRPLELRACDDLHDRFVVPTEGPLEAIGTSLNSAHRHLTTYVIIEGAEASLLRDHLEALWSSARILFPPEI
jgi:hypothetical protein